jgi:DNA-binding MarR family transcriptional regulator
MKPISVGFYPNGPHSAVDNRNWFLCFINMTYLPKNYMGKFWMYDRFIRIYAKDLSVYDHSVYMSICSHANALGETFIGCRRMCQELGIDKNTVIKSINRLEASGFVRRLRQKNGRVSILKLLTARFENVQPSCSAGHKEDIKEIIKEEQKENNKDDNINDFLHKRKVIDDMRKSLEEQGIMPRRLT